VWKCDESILGSACVSHAGEGVLAIANFLDGWDLLDSCEVERKFVSARRRNQTRGTRALPMMTAAFDVQLGECFLQRSLNPCDLCSSVIFLHRGLGALDSGLSRSDVDLLSL